MVALTLLKGVGVQYLWLNVLVSASPPETGEMLRNQRLPHVGGRLPADTPTRRCGEIGASSIRRAKNPADRLL
ncbi:hypothetical protein [Mycolicibacterium llatzerense]|uniref:hypothetical protein n=1 Tax=Mycolicibacterium llatzerense TaxID=280871 RepID=UPI0021B58DAA|nr:hypothetical protein [Mycolicibacterium llatzerense]MCT7367677.1 hypothetical protein [Mycolicibacterium llatzerense]